MLKGKPILTLIFYRILSSFYLSLHRGELRIGRSVARNVSNSVPEVSTEKIVHCYRRRNSFLQGARFANNIQMF